MPRLAVRLVSWFSNLRMKRKLILTYVILSLLPVSTIFFVANAYINSLLITHEKTLSGDALKRAAMQVDTAMEAYNTLSNYIFSDSVLLKAVNTSYGLNFFQMYMAYTYSIEPTFLTYYALHSDLRQLTIYTQADLYPLSNYVAPYSKLAAMPWYPKVAGKYQPTWVLTQNEQGDPLLLSVRRLMRSEKYKTVNYIYMDIDYESFFAPLSDIISSEYGIMVLDGDGEKLYTKRMEQDATGPDDFSQGLKWLNKNHGEYVFLSEPIALGTVYFYQPMTALAQRVQSIIGFIFLALWSALLLLGVLAWFFSAILVRPVEALTRNMQAVAKGRLNVTVASDRTDEIGMMIGSFTTMIGQLKHLIQVVYKNELEKKEYQLRLLYAQINPHFLYNALSLINSQALLSGNDGISRITLLLSSFYRTALNRGQDMTTVENELKNIRAYVGIQRIMCDDSFSAVYEIADGMMDCLMPNFILQPVVENAIGHGLMHADRPDRLLSVSLTREEDHMVFTIQDNGAGMTAVQINALLHQANSGYGMNNVSRRLALLYADAHSLLISSTPGEGTRVTIRIPIAEPEAAQ